MIFLTSVYVTVSVKETGTVTAVSLTVMVL